MAVKAKANLSGVNALAELDRISWKYEPVGDYEVKVKCPVHDDSSPSVTLNTEKNVWKCHASSCNVSGDIASFLAHANGVERSTILIDLSTRYDIGVVRTMSPEIVEKYHEKIWDSGPLIKALRDRALTDEDIRKHRIGFNEGRITIPIYDRQRRIVNIRKYLPGAPGAEKMRNSTGYGKITLFMPEQLQFTTVMIVGGEMKAIVASRFLNPIGVGAVCATGGEGSWDPSLTPLFKDKIVYVCMDVDSAGVVGGREVAAQIVYAAQAVKICKLPLDRTKYPTGDINDWVAKENAGEREFQVLIESAVQYVHQQEQDTPVEKMEVSLGEATSAKCIGRRVQFIAVPAAMDTTPYLIPKLVAVSCTKDQEGCTHCPVKPIEPDEDSGKVVVSVKPTSSGILDLIGGTQKEQRDGLLSALRIPPCKAAKLSIRDYYNVRDVRLTPELSRGNEDSDHVIQSAFVVGDKVDLNSAYILGGRVYPHPKTQQAILLLDSAEEAEDGLSSFDPTDEELKELELFKPDSWSTDSLRAKLHEIYDDLESNVTRIFKRRALHLVCDLTWHSVLYFNHDERVINGWVNSLIVGDSSQGKSETADMLLKHYGVGVKHDCKNASVSGLLGGVQKMGDRWFASWGVIPLNDRRLVVLEELKGAPIEVIGKLTDMRSSGVAEIAKIERRRTHARTRLLMISNPRSDKSVSAHNFGIEAIKDLVGGLEDVRRFDLAAVVSSTQVHADEINKLSSDRAKFQHRFTTELCRRLVLWSWTRKPEEIKIDPEAERTCIKKSAELCSKFSEVVPLIDRGTCRLKLLRLSTALAARTASFGDTRHELIVRPCHVEFVAEFLDRSYSEPSFGYADFSRAQNFATQVLDPEVVEAYILQTKYPRDFVEHLLHSEDIAELDFEDWCEIDKEVARKMVAFFVRKHAIYRLKRWYVKTAQFIDLLKRLKVKGISNEPTIDPKGKDKF